MKECATLPENDGADGSSQRENEEKSKEGKKNELIELCLQLK